ncbi:MAG TPA: endonuclease III [Actinomycetota bacterium]|nr:endonuclease III [Actinomycetota bacterium]
MGTPSRSAKGATRNRIRAVHRRLRATQGPFTPKPRLPILDELIATVLSQHTSDVNTARAFASLKERFPDWSSAARAPVRSIEAAIRSGGLAAQKAPRIKSILATVKEREGRADLARLDGLTDDEVEEYLCSLPGVGPKTAACVLAFSMGRPAFPIDVHVHRIALRLGLIPDRTTAEAAHRLLTPNVPPQIRYELHMQLIHHGRTICTARRPRCSECPLLDLCASGPVLLARGDAR